MLNEQQAQELMSKLVSLRSKANKISVEGPEKDTAIKELKRHENLCVKEFSYLITMHTNRYKQFANFEDLNQEGFLALLKAMNNYDPKKGSVFWWIHKYVGTRVSRQANLHTTIRYPLKIAKEQVPRREFSFPMMIEETFCPDKQAEFNEIAKNIKHSMHTLRGRQRKIITWYFGFHGDKPCSINKICETLDIPRSKCLTLFREGLEKLKAVVKI